MFCVDWNAADLSEQVAGIIQRCKEIMYVICWLHCAICTHVVCRCKEGISLKRFCIRQFKCIHHLTTQTLDEATAITVQMPDCSSHCIQ